VLEPNRGGPLAYSAMSHATAVMSTTWPALAAAADQQLMMQGRAYADKGSCRGREGYHSPAQQ